MPGRAESLERLPEGLRALAADSIQSRNNLLADLMHNPTLPDIGVSDLEIRLILNSLALMDANNDKKTAGVGEREGRILSSIVRERSLGFAHGVGRSGDLLEVQPKALGSSILQKLTHSLLKQSLKIFGLHKSVYRNVLILPVATGMAIMLTLQALRKRLGCRRQKVLWIRADQKSALKAILLAGLAPVVIENVLMGDEVQTDLRALEETIHREGSESILCVLSCISCFAPRAPDLIVDIGKVCRQHGIGHIVNNAYGFQSTKAISLLNETVRTGGQLDAIVGSTDKNFCVPVGGAIIAGPDASFVRDVGKIYPGRASSEPILNLFITLLSLGRNGLSEILSQRKVLFCYFKTELEANFGQSGFRLLKTPHNDISLAVAVPPNQQCFDLGSKLFHRKISGARLICPGSIKNIDGICLDGFGAHLKDYPTAYFNVAAAIGQTKDDIDLFTNRLLKLYPKKFLI